MLQTIVVTAAIIHNKGKLLIAQRKKDTDQALKWEFPGGKLEPGESPEHCLVREIKEELGLDITVEKIFDVVSHNYGERHIILLCYLCKLVGGRAQTLDCHAFRWVESDELMEYDFALADRPVVQRLREIHYKLEQLSHNY